MRKRSELRRYHLRATLLGRTSSKITTKARDLQTKWRLVDLASALSAMLALLFAIVDYEERWNDDRTHSSCQMTPVTESYRFAILALSLAAIVLASVRHYIRVQWINTVNIARGVYMARRKGLLNLKFFVEVLILGVFPYPALSSELHITQVVDTSLSLVSLCYYWSELLFIVMFCRVFFLFRAIINFSKYFSDTSYAFCKDLEIKPNVRFSYRCLIRESPVVMLAVFLVSANAICTVIMRVFERPMQDLSGFDHKYFISTLWLVSQTIFSVAYGDIYPVTTGGRSVSVLCSIVGVCSFSFLVFLIERAVSLNSKERQVFVKINLVKTAARCVFFAIKYYHAKKHLGANSQKAKELYIKMLEALDANHRRIEFLEGKASIADEIMVETQSKEMMAVMRRIEKRVNRMQLDYCLDKQNQ
jgi:hypothetical protein